MLLVYADAKASPIGIARKSCPGKLCYRESARFIPLYWGGGDLSGAGAHASVLREGRWPSDDYKGWVRPLEKGAGLFSGAKSNGRMGKYSPGSIPDGGERGDCGGALCGCFRGGVRVEGRSGNVLAGSS